MLGEISATRSESPSKRFPRETAGRSEVTPFYRLLCVKIDTRAP